MESNFDKDIKKVSLEENNDNKDDNKNISSNENNKEIDNNEKKKNENIENLDDKNNNININNNFMIGSHMAINYYNNMNYSPGAAMMQQGYSNSMFQCFLSENQQEYYNFCKDLSFIHNNQITVKINQKFAEKFSNNYTVPPQFWKDIPSVQSKIEGIEYIDTRTFYPHPYGLMGGDSVTLMVFKATKKGKFKINFPNNTVDVNVIE